MYRLWSIVAMCMLATCASASIDFWFTSGADGYGLVDPSKAFRVTGTNGTDYLDGWALANNAVPPPTTDDVLIDCGSSPDKFAYIWARFNDEPIGSRIDGIAIGVDGAGAGIGNIAWYKCDNGNDYVTPPGNPIVRWDGAEEVFYYNPAGLIAITAWGVRNLDADYPTNLYVAGDDHTFLLGAVRCDNCPDELSFVFGASPVCYSSGVCPDVNALNRVICVPEPACLALFALAGLVLRRR